MKTSLPSSNFKEEAYIRKEGRDVAVPVIIPHRGPVITASSGQPDENTQLLSLLSNTALPSSPPPPPPSTNIPILAAAFFSSLATGGPTYAFGLYGATLKATLHLTQTSLDTLSSANFCAGFVGWIPGMCVDHWGPRAGLTVGGVTMSVVLTLYWTVARQIILVSEAWIVPTLSFLGVMIFMSNSLVVGSLFKALVVSSGKGKGAAVGAAKGYLGLGAGVYSCLFDSLKYDEESDLDFLMMAAGLSIIAIALPGWFCLPPKETLRSGTNAITDGSTSLHYNIIYIGLSVLAVLVVGTSCLSMFTATSGSDVSSVSEEPRSGIKTAVLILLAWWGPILSLFLLPKAGTHPSEDVGEGTDPETVSWVSPSAVRSNARCKGRANGVQKEGLVVRDYNLIEVLNTIEGWLFLWTCIVAVGSGTILTNNMGQMIESLGFPKQDTAACLSLFSVAQAGARVATGAWSEQALAWKAGGEMFGLDRGLPRTVFVVFSCLLSIAAHSILAVATERYFFVFGVLLCGIAFGMIWSPMVLVVGDVFGTRHHGANYMFYDGFSCALGTLLISKYIAQAVYQNHAVTEENTCFGPECFQNSHIAVAILSATSAATSIAMLFLTKSSYGRPLV